MLREVTSALLSAGFFAYLSTTFGDEMLSVAQTRIILSDIACCSLMRLDVNSLDKLLDLMVMIFKWQMFLMNSPDDLLDMTLKHLHGICHLMPDQHKMLLVDNANQYFIKGWNELDEDERYSAVRRINKFLAPFHTRISLLIRIKLQNRDGSFVDKMTAASSDFFRYYLKNNGENIYEKISNFSQNNQQESLEVMQKSNEIDQLFHQFNVDLIPNESKCIAIKPSESFRKSVRDTDREVTSKTSKQPIEATSNFDKMKIKLKLDDQKNDQENDEENFHNMLLNMLGDNTS